MRITRRDYLRTASGATLAAIATGQGFGLIADGQAQPTLRAAADAKGINFGSCSDEQFRNQSEAYKTLFLNQCALYAGILAWAGIAPDIMHEDDERDPNVAVALAAGLKLTGAHLLWHEHTPAWLESLSREKAQEAAAAHIQRLAGFYRGKCFSWNVVNEAIHPQDHAPDGLRVDSPLPRALGPDFFEAAFRQARIADPAALLLYNEYDLELDTPDQEARRVALFHLLDRLQKANAPIDGVGLQSHLKLARMGSFNETKYRGFLHELSQRGLKIVITELDVDDRGAPAGETERDRAVADVYSKFLAVALDETSVIALVTWGLVDPFSWLNHNVYFPQFVRPDGLPQRPLLLDAALRPKPAYDAVLRALQHAPQRGSTNR
ncbi:MAG: endo-1,4-beta-xylanase [Terracidiphilus sp.]|jgi:endo-1,4-beta-xylanase